MTYACRREPTLEELLADDVMRAAIRSAGLGADEFRATLRAAARRLDDRDDLPRKHFNA